MLQHVIGASHQSNAEEKKEKERERERERDKTLSAKEQMAKRKEEQAKRRADELAMAAKGASRQMAEYPVFINSR